MSAHFLASIGAGLISGALAYLLAVISGHDNPAFAFMTISAISFVTLYTIKD